jgi:hypothetical protein
MLLELGGQSNEPRVNDSERTFASRLCGHGSVEM